LLNERTKIKKIIELKKMEIKKELRNLICVGFVVLLIVLFLFSAAGCQKTENEDKENVSVETGLKELPKDLVEKRGMKTNITEFQELARRASSINSFKYKFSDTETGVKDYHFTSLNRFVKLTLPELKEHKTGEVFNEVFMDKLTETALSHCGLAYCPKGSLDKEVEKVEFDDYYIRNPVEYLYRATDAEFVKEELLDDQYTKVFSVTFEGRPARIWLQEYYGFPLKIVVRNEDESKRTIKFDDVMIDSTRRGEIDLPFNFTVKGEPKSWVFWEHYLGEWPPKNAIHLDKGQDVKISV
jgi:hypothetical protein